MKRVSTVLAAVAMMIGAFGGAGCKQANSEVEKPVEQQTEATTDTASNAGTTDEAGTVVVSASVQIPAPPALRTENPGRAPSTRHVWQRGFWRWDRPGTQYVWVPGHWEHTELVAPYAPPAPRYEDPGYPPSTEYLFVPGYWRWSGAEYVWVVGHWTNRRDAGSYYRPRWENRNGRWGTRMERWDDNRVQAWEREHPRHAPTHEGPAPQPRPRLVTPAIPRMELAPKPIVNKPSLDKTARRPAAHAKPARPRTGVGAKPANEAHRG